MNWQEIRELRHQAGVTQEEMARRLGISTAAYLSIERYCSPDLLTRAVDILRDHAESMADRIRGLTMHPSP